MRSTWFSRALAGAMALLLAATLAPSAVAAGPDTVPPTLVGSEVTVDNYNLQDGPSTVTIRVHITDESGTQTPTTILSHDASGQSFGFTRYLTLVEGTPYDGWWESTGSIPSGAADGEWAATIYPLSDTFGNSAGLDHPSFFGELEVFDLYYAETLDTVPAPTFADASGTESGTVTVPAAEGVSYVVNNERRSAGTYSVLGSASVVAEPTDGFEFADGLETRWTYEFSDVEMSPDIAVEGTARVGESLTVTTDGWKPTEAKPTYRWLADGAVIAGANSRSLTLTADHVGTTVTAEVTATRAGYETTTATSALSAKVAPGTLKAGTPGIAGTSTVGSTLTATAGTWTSGTAFTYQWRADGVVIEGATAKTYTLSADERGKKISVMVTGSKAGYETATATSAETEAVVKGALVTDRLAGSDRYATAIAASKRGYPDGSDVVYLATGLGYADALVAAPAAAEEGAPLLLTRPTVLTADVKAEIQRLKPSKIVVVGGEGAVNKAVVSELKKIAPNTVRRGGSDRYATAAAVVTGAFDQSATAYVATGLDYPDALSASAVAAANDAPVLLVRGTAATAPEATTSTLEDLGVTKTIVTGGPAIVSNGIATSLKPFGATRQYGSDRFATNQKLNATLVKNADHAYLATGFDYPDALAGAAIAGTQNAPLYLVRSTCIPADIHRDINASTVTKATLLGGTGVLTKDVAEFKACP